MKILLLVFAGVVAFPCSASAGSPYFGVEAGLLSGRSNDIDEFTEYSVSAVPPAAPTASPPVGEEFDDALGIRYKKGLDVGISGGYDFGWLRLELEVAHKQSDVRDVVPDDITDEFIASVNSNLNRPADGGLPALAIADFSVAGKLRASSALVNALIDVPIFDRVSAYAGGGMGRSWVKALGDRDSARAWQWLAGIRYAVRPNLELGLKYRYFNSGIVKLRHSGVSYPGNPAEGQATNLFLRPEIEGEYRARSVLATLHFKL